MPRYTDWTPPAVPFRRSDVGVTNDTLLSGLRRGTIVRLIHGVYVASDVWRAADGSTRHLMLALAHQTRNPDLVASHETAALAQGVALPDTRTAVAMAPRFTVTPAGERRSRSDPRIKMAALPPGHVVELPTGLVVTSPARTAVDIAAECELIFALVPLDDVARRGTVKRVGSHGLRGDVSDRVIAAAVAPLHEAADLVGTRLTRRHLAAALQLTDPRHESPGESISAVRIHESDLPDPEPQPCIETPVGNRYPDFGWLQYRTIGEVDGMVKYQGSDAARVIAAEKWRQMHFEQAGWQALRWGPMDMVIRPGSTLEYLRGGVRRHGWDG